MATYYQWKCESCSYMVETDGPHEFYIDSHGQRQRYGHPLPRSDEAEKAGVSGLTTVAYCPVCDEVHEVVIEQFDPPRNFITCWLGAHNLIEPACPECGNTLLDELPDVPCPRCASGKFTGGVVKVT